MRKRESRAVCLSALITLLIIAPAFAIDWPPAQKDYGNFTNVYEFDPWSAESSVWTNRAASGVPSWTNTPGGAEEWLNYSDSADGKYNVWSYNHGDAVGTANEWTIEVHAKVTANGGQVGTDISAPAGLVVGVLNDQASGYEASEMVIQTTAIYLRVGTGWVQIDDRVNTGGVTLRMNKVDLGGGQERVWVWRDGETTPISGYNNGNGDGGYHSHSNYDSYLFFGDDAGISGGASDGLSCEIDYVAFELGTVYTPEPATLMVMLSGLATCLLVKRKRR